MGINFIRRRLINEKVSLKLKLYQMISLIRTIDFIKHTRENQKRTRKFASCYERSDPYCLELFRIFLSLCSDFGKLI